MEHLLQTVTIKINEKIFLKDPESSDLGKRIVENSILMISEMGFECFTFKKLGIKIGSNESSIYRYFENKHKLLLYLTSWYWGWLEYQLVFATNGISDYPYPSSLASTLLEGSLHQHFLRDHFSSLTDFRENDDQKQYFLNLVFSSLKS